MDIAKATNAIASYIKQYVLEKGVMIKPHFSNQLLLKKLRVSQPYEVIL